MPKERMLKRAPPRPKLEELMRRGREIVEAMTPEQKAAMIAEQAKSYGRSCEGTGRTSTRNSF